MCRCLPGPLVETACFCGNLARVSDGVSMTFSCRRESGPAFRYGVAIQITAGQYQTDIAEDLLQLVPHSIEGG